MLCCAVLLGGWDRKLLLLGMLHKPHHHQASVPSGTVQTSSYYLVYVLDSIISSQAQDDACVNLWSYGVKICASSCDPYEDRQCRAGHTSAPRNANVLRVESSNPATWVPPPDEILGWKADQGLMAHSRGSIKGAL